jgi:hypothetical protein
MQNVPGRKVNVLGGHSVGRPNQRNVSYSEQFPR